MGLERRVLCTADECCDRSGRLSTLRKPMINTLDIELEVVILHLGIIPAEDFKELAVTRRADIGCHDTVCRVVSAPRATHSDLYHFSDFPYLRSDFGA